MSASNLGIIFAFIAALILLGAAQPSRPPAQREQPEAAAANERSPLEIVIRNPPRERPDPGCERRQDNRQSDLCAQWKAADAARDAADVAFWALLVGVAGTVFLLITLTETRKAGQREQRAYIKLDVPNVPDPSVLMNGIVTVVVTNYGTTPALEARFEGTWFIGPKSIDETYLERELSNCGEGGIIHPGSPKDFGIHAALTFNQKSNVASEHHDDQLYATAKCTYRDVFGQRHVEAICVRLNVCQPTRVFISHIGNNST